MPRWEAALRNTAWLVKSIVRPIGQAAWGIDGTSACLLVGRRGGEAGRASCTETGIIDPHVDCADKAPL
jgi:hypothetical protein